MTGGGVVTRLKQVNEQRLIQFRAKLEKRKNQKGEPIAKETIAAHLRNMRAALNWAQDAALINKAPKIRMPKLTKGSRAKGRAITREEFDRMIDVAEKSLLPERLAEWRFFLFGLWWSGLRLGEALELSWDEWADAISVDLSGEYGMFQIPGEAEKGGRNRLLPMAEEFEEQLRAVPEGERTGLVFNPAKVKPGCEGRASQDTCCRFITSLGKRVGVVVDRKGDSIKFASAHDLRRSFGVRWASRLPASELQQLMRHESITTTMTYYIEQDANRLAASIREWRGPTLGHTTVSEAAAESAEVLQTS